MKTKFTEAQIVYALCQTDTGVTIAEVCRKMSISEARYHNWKKKCSGWGVPELCRLWQFEYENHHLKQLMADSSLDKQWLQAEAARCAQRKVLKPVQRRHASHHLIDAYRISARRACRVIGLQRASFAYQAHGRDDMILRQRISELSQVRVRYGSQRL